MQATTRKTFEVYMAATLKYPRLFWWLMASAMATTGFAVGAPMLGRLLIDSMTLEASPWAGRENEILWVILAVALLHQVNYRVFGLIVNRLQPRVMADLMNTSYRYIIRHSYGFYADSYVGSVVTRIRRYSQSYELLTDVMLQLLPTAVRMVLILGVLAYMQPAIGLVVLAWTVLYIVLAVFVARRKLKIDLEFSERDTKATGHLADTITNVMNLKLFASADREAERLVGLTERVRQKRQESWDFHTYVNFPQGFSMAAMETTVMFTALASWRAGIMTVGDVVLVQAYLAQVFERMWEVTRQMKTLYEALAYANEMTEMLMQPHEVTDVPRAKGIVVPAGDIWFQNVDFRYHESSEVFQGFNLHVRPGERVALVGRSGSGKTTVTRLLLRFKDVQGGQVLVDGQDIASVTQDSLWEKVSLVPQDPILLHRSLLENIRYGKPGASMEEVVAAAQAAHAHGFISKSQFGYETLVGERGIKLSGGEKQRVAIARAILKNAPILVLDEATSSVDNEAEAHIQAALDNLMCGKTTIVIAHRLSTVRKMDRIIVMEEGKIIEEGSHDELLKKTGGAYRRQSEAHQEALLLA